MVANNMPFQRLPSTRRPDPIPVVRQPPIFIDFGPRVAFVSKIDTPTLEVNNQESKPLHSGEHESLIRNIALAEAYLKAGRRVVFNFDATEEITIEALAYLLGNIEVLLHFYKGHINGTYSQHESVNQLLRDSGFLRILKYSDAVTSDNPPTSEIVHLNFVSGSFVEAEEITPLREEVTKKEISIPKVDQNKIFRAISEAMLNVHHHAYSGVKHKLPKHSFVKGRWWLGAQFNKKTRVLNFAMYDIGQGIPASMPRNYDLKYLQSFSDSKSSRCTDAELIYAATRPGKTSTKKRHRGRGLPDMHQIVENNRGEMWIYSGFGRYYFTGKNSHKNKLDINCAGTLVLWSIYTDELVSKDNHDSN